ncbi:MAG: group II intron reverse transcriptase/maturase [Planctomycetota bacterium]
MIGLERWPQVKSLRQKLNGKAKAEPEFRFYVLFDKVHRRDFLEAAYAQVRANHGAPGVDGENFECIKSYGVGRYLAELADELKELRYTPQPVRRVLIPKAGKPGQFRPLGIPTIRDRIVQQSVKLLLEPIFEADFTDNAYGYRPGKSARDALLDVDAAIRSNHVDYVDADLSQYFDTIPHDDLMQSVQRRVVDRRVLWLIRHWLKVPVHETNADGKVVITGGKKTKRGTPQGGVISPLLANIYFRRFLKAWEDRGLSDKLHSRVVSYADDFVILTKGRAREALEAARAILTKMGLRLNDEKTRTGRAWYQTFNFLGYTFGKLYTAGGKAYLGFTPSGKSIQRYRDTVRQLTAKDQALKSAEAVAEALNRLTRGFWNYFNVGTTMENRRGLDKFLFDRTVRWAKRKYPRSRGRADRGKARFAKIEQALQMLVFGRTLSRHPSVQRG